MPVNGFPEGKTRIQKVDELKQRTDVLIHDLEQMNSDLPSGDVEKAITVQEIIESAIEEIKGL